MKRIELLSGAKLKAFERTSEKKVESEVGSARKILVVDDNVDAADLTAEVLRHFGLSVDVAYGGREGFAAAMASAPDVIFLDLGMPVMDGYEVAKALRAEVAMRRMKIVALTAWGDQAAREQTKTAGFDLHLIKPAAIAELVAIAQGGAQLN